MQSSSVARFASAFVIAVIILAYSPSPLSSGARAQASLPSANLTTVATTAAPAAQQTQPAHGSSASGSLTGTVAPKKVTPPAKPTTTTSSGPRLVIPSIGLNNPIVNVGLTAGGAMAVPNGSTNNVGLYNGGPMPGQVGTAVLDAHVFAAFSKLHNVSVGDSLYVQRNGRTLRFVVTAVKTYALSQITSADLFTPTSKRDLNLITCAGKLTADHSTYDHRLVVYTTLAS